MTKDKVNTAIEAARAILQKERISHIPVPVEHLAKKRGILVQAIPLDDELSGMSFIKNDISVIVVNATHHPNRQRFTLAHELAHHVLHHDYLQNNVHIDKAVLRRNHRSSEGTDLKEIQANAFAAELLMPKPLLRRFKNVDVNDDLQLSDLARKFKVSTSAMAIRLDNLG